jgi:inosine-uridine nucleoside N-ribohydrolase
VTNITQLGKDDFERIASGDGVIQKLFGASSMARKFAQDADARVSVFDALALAYLIDPGYATEVEELFIDVDISFGPGYGRTYGYWHEQPARLLQKMKVVKRFDNRRFFDWYVDLLTRPVPVAPAPGRARG